MKTFFHNMPLAAALFALGLVFLACEQATAPSGDSGTSFVVSPNGGVGAVTTAIDFLFSTEIEELLAENITIEEISGAAAAEKLTGSGRKWSLAVTVKTEGGVAVSIDRAGISKKAQSISLYSGGGKTTKVNPAIHLVPGDGLLKVVLRTQMAPTPDSYVVYWKLKSGADLSPEDVIASPTGQVSVTENPPPYPVFAEITALNNGDAYTVVVVGKIDGEVADASAAETAKPSATVNAETPVVSQPANGGNYWVNDGVSPPITLRAPVIVTDGGTVTYQWYRTDTAGNTDSGIAVGAGGTLAPGAAAVTYTLPPTAMGTVGKNYYFVKVTNTNTAPAVTGTTVAVTASVQAAVAVYDTLDLNAFTTSANIKTALDSMKREAGGGINGNQANPLNVPVTKADFVSASNNLQILLQSIKTSNYYVNLEILNAVGSTDFPDLRTVSGPVDKTKILSLTLPDTITGVAAGWRQALDGFTGLKSISFLGVAAIGYREFQGHLSLETVDLPKATSIGSDAFFGCANLKSVSLPEVKTIGYQAFRNCDSLLSVNFPKTTEISELAFFGCDGLKNVDLPEAKIIGREAISECSILERVYLPAATEIKAYAFSLCRNLVSVNLPEATSIGDRAFSGCTSLTSVSLPNAETIGGSAFYNCSALTSVSLPEAKTIDSSVFGNCTSLISASLPNVSFFPGNTFMACNRLVSVYMPGVTTLSTGTFYGCASLPYVDVSNVVDMGERVFAGCTSLSTMKLPISPPNLLGGNNIFEDIGSAAPPFYQPITFQIPLGTDTDYSNAGWVSNSTLAFQGGYLNATVVEY